MRPHQTIMTAHPMIYPSHRRSMVDSFLDRGADWIRAGHIPWHQNPLVLWELEAVKKGRIKYGKRKAHEWRWKGVIYHRDIFNHVWRKENGKMNWVGIYDPITDTIDYTYTEPK